MIGQQLRDWYYGLVRVAALPNHYRTRTVRRLAAPPEGLYLHLGCGKTYIPGMVNIDGNIFTRKDLWIDMRNGLPFPDGSAFVIYCSHTLEHFYPHDALRLLREMHRVLAPTGTVRIAVPCLEHALRIAAGEATFDYPRPFDDPHGQAINYLFCEGQHKYGYSFGVLAQFARAAGFGQVANYSAEHGVAPRQYGAVTLGDEYSGSLVVELRR